MLGGLWMIARRLVSQDTNRVYTGVLGPVGVVPYTHGNARGIGKTLIINTCFYGLTNVTKLENQRASNIALDALTLCVHNLKFNIRIRFAIRLRFVYQKA